MLVLNRHILHWFLVFFAALAIQAQPTTVEISEVKKGKRTQLFAHNTSTDTLNVLLIVDPKGYRRRAIQPVVRDIPPGRKILMATLIELADQESSYTYELVVNPLSRSIRSKQQRQAPDIEKLVHNKVVIFTKQGCPICDQLVGSLQTQRIAHTAFGIEENSVIYRQFMQYISSQLTIETKIEFPIIWNRDEVEFGFEDLSQLLHKLKR